jgi:hypothetical protein
MLPPHSAQRVGCACVLRRDNGEILRCPRRPETRHRHFGTECVRDDFGSYRTGLSRPGSLATVPQFSKRPEHRCPGDFALASKLRPLPHSRRDNNKTSHYRKHT